MQEDAGARHEGELTKVRDELAASQAEVERLRAAASVDHDRAEVSLAEAARLQAELTAATDAATAFDIDLAAMREMLDAAEQRIKDGAARYRELAVRSEPALPPDLIAGETVEAIDASVVAARELTGRIRSQIESQAQAARVPAGAPHRAAFDLSAMTPEQKIRYGLEQRAGR